ncbi:MAG: hypothetical protein DCF20_10395 [Pseudanabaena sp.]|nr:MAG: hypothetical protein DCF20_10395 [Pseudanabaena sp.]
MTIKEKMIEEIGQASEESLIQLMQLWQQVKKTPILPSISKHGFMRFAGIAKTESHILQQIEKDIEINRELDLQRLVP